jgi:flavorubredoxin
MTATPIPPATPPAPLASAERRVLQLPIEPGLICLRGLSPKRIRFEVEYGLERGTCSNAFLFEAGTTSSGHAVPPVLVHPPGESFAAQFLVQLEGLVAADAALKVVVGVVNPNRVLLLRRLAARWPALMLVASNAGARLLEELWNQRRPSEVGEAEPSIPPLPRGADGL